MRKRDGSFPEALGNRQGILTIAVLVFLLGLSGCKLIPGLVVNENPCASGVSGARTLNTAAARQMAAAPVTVDCEAIRSYRFDARHFSPELENESPETEAVTQEVNFLGAAVGIDAEILHFSTRSAALSDPKGMRDFPESYRYTEYRAYIVEAPQLLGSSDNSFEEALQKAVAACRAGKGNQ